MALKNQCRRLDEGSHRLVRTEVSTRPRLRPDVHSSLHTSKHPNGAGESGGVQPRVLETWLHKNSSFPFFRICNLFLTARAWGISEYCCCFKFYAVHLYFERYMIWCRLELSSFLLLSLYLRIEHCRISIAYPGRRHHRDITAVQDAPSFSVRCLRGINSQYK